MPELPEVDVIRRQLTPLVVGKTIQSIEVLLKKTFIGNKKDLIGKKIIGIDRKGKVLIIRCHSRRTNVIPALKPESIKIIDIDSCPSVLSPSGSKDFRRNDKCGRNDDLFVHLRMSGQLRFLPQKESPSPGRTLLKQPQQKHLRIIIHFTDHSQLHFIDQRTFGFITTNPNVVPKGIDALDLSLTVSKLKEILSKSKKPIKTLLLDQNLIAGIGNIYASEILWDSRIDPALKGQSSHPRGLSLIRLQKSIRKILIEAIQYGGSTISDQLYRQVKGQTGGYQKRFRVYDREGEPCLRCQTPIKKMKQCQRSTYFCPKCQR